MSTAKRLAWIAAGYAFSAAAGLAAVALNELRISEDVAQSSSGMVAFGDMILFVLVTGFFSLAPTWFLLKLSVEKAPRTLLAIELLAAVMGPVSWLALTGLVGGPPGDSRLSNLPELATELLVLYLAFGAIPRMVLGPVFLVIEAVTFFLMRGPIARTLLGVAMLMDLVPLGMFALHMARAIRS